MPPDRLSVLVVDNDDDDLFLICDYLAGIDTFEIKADTEMNYKKGLKAILQNTHDIYLIDYLLGPHTGIELIRECTKAGINKPFILLTGKGDRQIDIEAANVGAYDYLTKSEINSELLERSLRYSVQRYSSFTAITESEKRYREIFNKSNDIIFVLDKDFRLVNFNPMMNSLLRYTPEELSNQPFRIFFKNPDEAENFIEYIKSGDAKKDIEIVLLTKPGDPKIFLASCSHITTPDGIGQYQGILYDYTNIKKSVAEQLLKEKIETTERLVRSLAHEIRNPLTNINLSLHQLEKDVPEENKGLTDIIKRNSSRINDMIGDLMNLSNPINKKEDEINLHHLLRSVLSIAMDRIKLKGVDVSEKYISKPVYITGDFKKLQMALLNIIINAVEAMEEGKGKLFVETVAGENIVSIKVKDNGTGISTEDLSHLFQPFFTGKKNGIGLGLATSHSFIQAHEGTIEVNSNPGDGATFIVKLKTSQLKNTINN
ncbi:MAG: ATP-binding protein [Bacteroidota bacterium]